MRLMTHVDLGVKQIAAEFLFVLCKERGRLNSLCPLLFYLSERIWEMFLLVVVISLHSFQSLLLICSVRGPEEILKMNHLKTFSVNLWIETCKQIHYQTQSHLNFALCILNPDFFIWMSHCIEPLWKICFSNSVATILITRQKPGLVPLFNSSWN